jgi:uncharacterized protein (DUF697 family)
MNQHDAETILAIAALAATADGNQSEAERVSVASAAARLGLRAEVAPGEGVAEELVDVATLAARLSDSEARRAAYETAAAVCHADGAPNEAEAVFLELLARSLGTGAETAAVTAAVSAVTPGAPTPAEAAAQQDLDTLILDQAILTAACELLPDRLANMAILPLQLRLVYTIGHRHGQQLDVGQVKDLAAALGIGAAAQVMESVVRKTLGGIAGGLLGGLIGGAAGVAAGSAVTFAATYALGHAAEQYYAQGRNLGTADLRALFSRFQEEAKEIYPRVEERIRSRAGGTTLDSVMRGIKAGRAS